TAVMAAENPPGEHIDDDGDVKPAFCRPNICEVRNPFAVGSRRLEGAIEHGADVLREPGAASTARSDGRPLDMPSVSRSRQTRLAPEVRPLARKLARTVHPSS